MVIQAMGRMVRRARTVATARAMGRRTARAKWTTSCNRTRRLMDRSRPFATCWDPTKWIKHFSWYRRRKQKGLCRTYDVGNPVSYLCPDLDEYLYGTISTCCVLCSPLTDDIIVCTDICGVSTRDTTRRDCAIRKNYATVLSIPLVTSRRLLNTTLANVFSKTLTEYGF